ncbi:lipopolysaccharide biosynthesis protein [Pseudochelatococcus sp. G4_1912]|uniref:lipopolysaccharide biosynthesis protein n=1 Tax=Pseudochelatococcus sp. G4_1912 TaxID=3114288 RepID=UPI0039C75196
MHAIKTKSSRRERFVALIPMLGLYGVGIGVRGLEVGGKLGLYMLAARILGAYDAGLFFLGLTWAGLASTIARMGLERALTRHLAAELAVGNRQAARADLITALVWTTLAAALIALLTIIGARPIAEHIFAEPPLAVALQLAALSIVPQTLAIVAGSALAGFQRGILAQIVQNALWPVLTLLALVLGAHDLHTLQMFLAGAMFASAVLGLAIIARRSELRRGNSASEAEILPEGQASYDPLPGLWRTAMPLGVVEVVQVSISSLPVLALGVFVDPATVGAFSVAQRISMLIWVVILSIGTISAPSFAAHHRRGDLAGLQHVNRRTRIMVMAFGLPPVGLMMFFPATFLELIGHGFDIAASALVIMAVGQMINCLLPCQDIMLAMTGHGVALRALNLLQLGVCIVLGAILLPLWGMTGAAILTAIIIAQGAIGTTLVLRRVMPGAF